MPFGQLPVWLGARRERPAGCLGAAPSTSLQVRCDAALSADLRLGLDVVRRPKDEVELERMRIAERATRAAFAAAVRVLVQGSTERSVQVELELAALRAGADAMAYDTIVGAGTNSAVLHFMPTDRRLADGDLVLIDAGADYRQYACDITRTYPVGGRLSAEQAELHAVVHAAERAAIERCGVGTEWVDVHMTAARVIAEGLVAFGVLHGEPDALVESGAVWLFFPHGIGHMVGLGVRDAAGPLRSRRDTPSPIKNLRINLPLEAGFVVTVEPGIYFVPAMLNDPERRARYRDAVDWDRVGPALARTGRGYQAKPYVVPARGSYGHQVQGRVEVAADPALAPGEEAVGDGADRPWMRAGHVAPGREAVEPGRRPSPPRAFATAPPSRPPHPVPLSGGAATVTWRSVTTPAASVRSDSTCATRTS